MFGFMWGCHFPPFSDDCLFSLNTELPSVGSCWPTFNVEKNSESLIKSFLHSNCFLLQYHKTRLIGERSTSNTVQMARTVHSHVIWTSPSCIASFVNMFRDHDLPSTTFHPSTLFSLTSLAVQHQKWAKIGSWHRHTTYKCCYECNREIRDLKAEHSRDV